MNPDMELRKSSRRNILHQSATRKGLALAATVLLLFSQAVELQASEGCERAREYYESGTKVTNFGDRKEFFLKAVELCPGYAEAQVNLADAYENLGDFDAAEKHYSSAISLGLQSAVPFIGLGEVFLKTGRYGLAQEAFERGLKIDSQNERLQAGMTIATERMTREKKFLAEAQIRDCLLQDEQFRLMCMCPGTTYEFLRKWICMPAMLFASGSVSLSREARHQLDEVGKALNSKELKDWSWLVIGHADALGSEASNVILSKYRAEAVKKYLVHKHGIDASRLKAMFYGKKRPRSGNATPEGRNENRRVEIVPYNP